MTDPTPNPPGTFEHSASGAPVPPPAPQAADAVLLGRVKDGDESAMTELFDRYGGMVYSVALRVLNDPGQAEDVMQEILLQVWRQAGTYTQGRGSLGAWLAVMARHRAIDVLRRRKSTDTVDEVALASGTDLARDVERNAIMDKVRVVLNALPSEQQWSLQLAFFEGLSHAEIAARTGDPLGTVKTRIRSALISVRKAITA